jgi:predicted DnaQ family exonuclease/DinG family helicase
VIPINNSGYPSPLEITCVALDLETTGLNSERDEIIEVGAVKFIGDQELSVFHSMINPYRLVPPFVRQLTGISDGDLSDAPPFIKIAQDLVDFIGNSPVIGHNVPFDIGFLARKGVLLFNNQQWDTRDLAPLILPYARDFSLAALARLLECAHKNPHRALDDAQATRRLFVALMRKAQILDHGTLMALTNIARRSQWSLYDALIGLLDDDVVMKSNPLEVDLQNLRQRPKRSRVFTPSSERNPVEEHEIESMLSSGGSIARCFPDYEIRQEQIQMARAVAQSLSNGEHLIVEGGTGIGKSVAYLLPSILFAIRNQTRVVISTNTINLQEQLIQKDIPSVVRALTDQFDSNDIDCALLKGRANYLCLRKWMQLASAQSLSLEDARIVSRTLVWLSDTFTGDKAELNLNTRDSAAWDRISARGYAECPGAWNGTCFYRTARDHAASAHVLVVNHSLLLSDLVRGGSFLPPYSHLIIDEAHHLEEEATRQFGFQVFQVAMEDVQDGLARLNENMKIFASKSSFPQSRRESLDNTLKTIEGKLPQLRLSWTKMCSALLSFMVEHSEHRTERDVQVRITDSLRKQPAWSQIEVLWSDFDDALRKCIHHTGNLNVNLEGLEESLVDHATLLLDVTDWLQSSEEMRGHIKEFIAHPETGGIYWANQRRTDASVVLNCAPLHIGPILEEHLFAQKESVILTSATLSTQGTFEHVRDRLALEDANELLLGSPFDYKRSVLLLLSEDMPEPSAPGYQEALQQSVADLAQSANGRTMVLFTSHAALKATHQGLRRTLEGKAISVLGQGLDGPPRRLIEQFQQDPRAVLLGTSSFWEGVDIESGALKVLVLARIPFNVPTDPIFDARSQLYEDPFKQYAVPQAVLRFRQGFGRLIRRQGDNGIIVVLDRRLTSRGYGRAFLDSIPGCTVAKGRLRDMMGQVSEWLS